MKTNSINLKNWLICILRFGEEDGDIEVNFFLT